jgi:stage II sporulation protein D
LPDVFAPAAAPITGLVAIGRGFGHGVGMSQWGAFGLARRGEGFEAILRHFYRGVQVGPFRESVAQLSALPASAGRPAPSPAAVVFRLPTVIANREP